VFVNGASVPEFNRAVVLGGGEPELSPLPPEDRENDAMLSSGGGSDAANGGGETEQTDAANNGGETEQADALLASGGGLAEQAAPDMKTSQIIPDPVVPRYAYAHGALAYPSFFRNVGGPTDTETTFTGAFGFNLDLQTGVISDAEINANLSYSYPNDSYTWGSWAGQAAYFFDADFYNGTGMADANGFWAKDFSGNLITHTMFEIHDPVYADNGSFIEGGANLWELGDGSNFGVSYYLTGDSYPPVIAIGGDGTGTIEHIE
jgi:hypothetical protein